MRVWRLIRKTHLSHAWDGEGAKLFGGRWNLEGTPATYTAASLSLALLEILAGFGQLDAKSELVAFAVQLREKLNIKTFQASELPKHWQTYPAPEEIQAVGDKWLNTQEPTVLSVPSTVVSLERNYVWNAKFFKEVVLSVSPPIPLPLDPRLLRFP